jgi:hypothetical protein
MKYLAIEKEKTGLSSEDFAPYLENEAREVWHLYMEDRVREFYFNQEHNAVLILECDNLKEAHNLLSNLPLVKNGLISFDIMELRPYTGFSRLISPE